MILHLREAHDPTSRTDTMTTGPVDSTEQARLARQRLVLARLYTGLTHDLLGFLNTMVLNLEVLRNVAAHETIDAKDAARIRRLAEVVSGEIPPLHEMVKAAMAQIRLLDPPTTRFDLRTLCEELAIVLAAAARSEKSVLRTTLADVPMTVAGDRDAVAHALMAAILGTLLALPQGSMLSLTLQADRREAVLSFLAQPDASGLARVPQADVAEAALDARAVLEQYGARLDESSSPDGSTAFVLTFPLVSLS